MFQTTKPPTRYIVQEFYPFIQTQQGLANVLTIDTNSSDVHSLSKTKHLPSHKKKLEKCDTGMVI
jgi:hypothetical protein